MADNVSRKKGPQPAGQALIHGLLPQGYEFPDSAVGKREMGATLSRLAVDDPSAYVDTVTKLRDVGNHVATYEGLTVGLDDIEAEYKKRDPIIKSALGQMKKAKNKQQKNRILRDAQGEILNITKQHPGQMTLQARSGGRGSFENLMRSVSSPVAAQDMSGNPKPWLITNSFAEGLSPSEFWVANAEARIKGAEAFSLVTEPGEMHKLMCNTMGDQVISETDCGTRNGVEEPIASSQIVDRFLVSKHGPFERNTRVTPKVIDALKKDFRNLFVRSPMTCEAPSGGICQKCYGLSYAGEEYDLGTNVGMIGAQALAEPLQQGAMSAKHAQGVLGAEGHDLYGFPGIQTFLQVPKKFPNAAVLSRRNGTVESVDKAPQGGHYVVVSGEKHYVHPDLTPTTKAGTKVEKGDALSTGIPKPNEVIKHKGLGEGRKYFTDRLHRMIDRDFHKNMDKRHIETLAKAQLSNAEVVEDPENHLLEGTLVDYNQLRDRLKKNVQTVGVNESVGQVLAESELGYNAGTKVNSKIREDLKQKGVENVQVAVNPPKVDFVMRSIKYTPTMHPDWMARLSHQDIKKTILNAAAKGDKADIHGYHPAPAYAFGREFGHGPKGKY